MPMTFIELTARCTAEERDALAWHLAMLRAKTTWETLRSATTVRRSDTPQTRRGASRAHGERPLMDIPPEGWKPR